MKSNVGSVDRGIRSIIGIIILSMLLIPDSIRWFGLLGLIPIMTAFISFCPLYRLFGISTCKTTNNNHQKSV
ncbi:DUF2892 domain-containing protein [Bacillus alkalicola]|uniref:DUF2892 domain-containing protein n=1 Tax=Evansella alkalicola TaxID=745819 RepID=A0ABS6JQU9_9BACI|nr:DUF2892 domain-containing protein [Bacillus alkalicola]